MKKSFQSFLAFCLVILTIIACKELPMSASSNEETEANDYMPFTGNGYVYRWQKSSTLTILLPTDASQAGVTGYIAAYRVAFLSGVNQWSSILNSLGITLVYVTSGANDVRVQWDDGSGPDIGLGVVGFAEIDSGSDPSRRIVMTTRLNYDWSAHSTSTIEEVASHEFGHMLGIWSHSFDPVDRMYPYVQGQAGLSGRDTSTMSYVYSLSADIDLTSWPNNTISVPSLPAGVADFRLKCSFGLEYLKDIGGFEPLVHQEFLNQDVQAYLDN